MAKTEMKKNEKLESDLEKTVKVKLESNGTLDRIRAEVRLDVIKAIKGEGGGQRRTEFEGTGDNFLIEELIGEYLR